MLRLEKEIGLKSDLWNFESPLSDYDHIIEIMIIEKEIGLKCNLQITATVPTQRVCQAQTPPPA